MRSDGQPNLQLDTRILGQQREVAMGGTACHQFDGTGILQAPKGTNDVAAEAIRVVSQSFGIPLLPVMRQADQPWIGGLGFEHGTVGSNQVHVVTTILLEHRRHIRMCQLFAYNGR